MSSLQTGQFKQRPSNIPRSSNYLTVRTGSITIASGQSQELISQTEEGELVALEATVNDLNMIIEITIYGDTNTFYTINDKSVRQLLERGNGLTVGDVTLLPAGTSPDRRGTPSPVFMFVKRVKDDTNADYFGNVLKTYTIAYEPVIPVPYKAIRIGMRSNSTATASVTDIEFHRIVYEDIVEGGYYYDTKVGSGA